MIGKYCYTDYYKSEIQNYIIFKKGHDTMIKSYNPSIEYLLPRSNSYVFIPSAEKDEEKDRMDLTINAIGYGVYKIENKKRKTKYSPFVISDFLSVIGNQDWFVGIRANLTVESRCLPYDKRARLEMNEALVQIEKDVMVSEKMEELQKCKNKKEKVVFIGNAIETKSGYILYRATYIRKDE